MNRVSIAPILFIVAGCAQPVSVPAKIDAKQAVTIAERFVRDNGYTDFMPPAGSKLKSESIEYSSEKERAAERHDTLRPQALGYIEETTNDSGGWTIGFSYVHEPLDPECGRAVTMDRYGAHVRMQHQEITLSFLKPKPE